MESIVTKYMSNCIICGKPDPDIHHGISGTANRKVSDAERLLFPVCPEHHNMGNNSIHLNPVINTWSKIAGELAWECQYLAQQLADVDMNGLDIKSVDEWREEAREKFRKKFGQNYV